MVTFRFTDVEPRAARWWMCVADGAADVCDDDPGVEVTVRAESTLRTLVQIWRGVRSRDPGCQDSELHAWARRKAWGQGKKTPSTSTSSASSRRP